MNHLSTQSTIDFDPAVHQGLKRRAAATGLSLSELVNESVRLLLAEDQEDLDAFSERADEPELSYEELLDDLRAHGKV
ncbi:MAG: hypothetical protein BECKG1743D_GA0114223_105092 [Candidatus Kentron sp. G]|nr:MAG: hypothetical protein BECKG1743F_GA0114225_104704 [Candidatus Kentron sp. G]VFN02238.1 MAG: hypothetical protein BECKG1743E_GA0114224_104854 [Candidatus Kentron sp. G]VFN03740.1 MAG: hypothetical protein BECKG1743D_GA0114223_105092 [Candidatus Kentron sp. G]